MSLLQRFRTAGEPRTQRLPKVLHAMEMLLVEQRSLEERALERFQDGDQQRDRDLDWEYEHMNDSVRYAKMLAARRKIDPDLAACAVAVQNIGRVTGGKTNGHAETGYEPARRLLAGLGCFTATEVEELARTVRNHSRKDQIDSPLDELSKDIDIYVRYLRGEELTKPHELHRLDTVTRELQKAM